MRTTAGCVPTNVCPRLIAQRQPTLPVGLVHGGDGEIDWLYQVFPLVLQLEFFRYAVRRTKRLGSGAERYGFLHDSVTVMSAALKVGSWSIPMASDVAVGLGAVPIPIDSNSTPLPIAEMPAK